MKKLKSWFLGLSKWGQWFLILAIIVVVGMSAVTVSATTWEYTNSPEFCGTACHTMPPEYVAYQVSPHARVDCVDCHLGQDSFLETVPRKAKEVRHVVNALTQAYEPPIYVKSLRPARDTCEKCHNPEKFSNDTFVEIDRFAEDEQNTEENRFMVVKTGGGTEREGLGRGIHWHTQNEVWYFTDDPLKQTIPYVQVIDSDGTTTEFFDVEAGLPPTFGTQVADQLQRMDCIDCHNRVSHLFRSPSDAMDDALARNVISNEIPFIKRKGVEILNEDYQTTEAGLAAIDALGNWYQDNYPDYTAENAETLEAGIDQLKTIFTESVFPNMNVGWETHPHNDGHSEFPGCFRCHDGKHTSPENETVRLECNLCHSIPEIVSPDGPPPVIALAGDNEPESHLDSNWMARHRFEFDLTCAECHDVSNPGGTDDSSFCSNSGCHATEWEFVGLDAPGIREIVAPPRVPGDGQPRRIPHPAGERTDCTICHGDVDSVIPTPENHAGFDQTMCTMCHEPADTDVHGDMPAVMIPGIIHQVENFEDQCVVCHEAGSFSPYPENHAAWQEDTCLFCHQEQEPTEAEYEGRYPPIPHTLDGRDDCMFCHQLDRIRPFPDNHENRPLDRCQNCHEPATPAES
jgi:nitrate/TMAO reductase-like tetraheme cytochrome c subunit